MEQTYFAPHQSPAMARGEFVAMATTGSDANLWVEFYTRPSPMPDPVKSEEEGRDIYVDVPWIRILVPGDRTKNYDRPAKLKSDGPNDQVPPDTVRFPQQWQSYLSSSTRATVGQPIEEWPPISRSEAEQFKRMDIHTVEQLAGLPDSSLTWLGGRKRRDQAIAWLQSAKDHAGEAKLAHENDQLKAQVEALSHQVQELAERLGESIEPAMPKRRGRPPKEAA